MYSELIVVNAVSPMKDRIQARTLVAAASRDTSLDAVQSQAPTNPLISLNEIVALMQMLIISSGYGGRFTRRLVLSSWQTTFLV